MTIKPWSLHHNGPLENAKRLLTELVIGADETQYEAARADMLGQLSALPGPNAHIDAHGTGEGRATIFVGQGDPLDGRSYEQRRAVEVAAEAAATATATVTPTPTPTPAAAEVIAASAPETPSLEAAHMAESMKASEEAVKTPKSRTR